MSGLSGRDVPNAADACGPHHFVWTWPIEEGRGAVGVCDLCGAVTTAERDAAIRDEAQAEALQEAADLLVAECSTVAAPCFCSGAPWLRDRAALLKGGDQ